MYATADPFRTATIVWQILLPTKSQELQLVSIVSSTVSSWGWKKWSFLEKNRLLSSTFQYLNRAFRQARREWGTITGLSPAHFEKKPPHVNIVQVEVETAPMDLVIGTKQCNNVYARTNRTLRFAKPPPPWRRFAKTQTKSQIRTPHASPMPLTVVKIYIQTTRRSSSSLMVFLPEVRPIFERLQG